jgi:hypothetical protein
MIKIVYASSLSADAILCQNCSFWKASKDANRRKFDFWRFKIEVNSAL